MQVRWWRQDGHENIPRVVILTPPRTSSFAKHQVPLLQLHTSFRQPVVPTLWTYSFSAPGTYQTRLTVSSCYLPHTIKFQYSYCSIFTRSIVVVSQVFTVIATKLNCHVIKHSYPSCNENYHKISPTSVSIIWTGWCVNWWPEAAVMRVIYSDSKFVIIVNCNERQCARAQRQDAAQSHCLPLLWMQRRLTASIRFMPLHETDLIWNLSNCQPAFWARLKSN